MLEWRYRQRANRLKVINALAIARPADPSIILQTVTSIIMHQDFRFPNGSSTLVDSVTIVLYEYFYESLYRHMHQMNLKIKEMMISLEINITYENQLFSIKGDKKRPQVLLDSEKIELLANVQSFICGRRTSITRYDINTDSFILQPTIHSNMR